MNNTLKWMAIIMGGLLAAFLLAGLFGFVISEQRINRTYEVAGQSLALPTDAEELAEGRRLVATRGCADCHGADWGGAVMIDDPALGVVYADNLTSGLGSAVADYGISDWERAIRHGVGPDDRSLYVMPVVDYAGLSDEDVARMIAYLQTIPAVDRQTVAHQLGPLGRVLFVAGQLPLLSAETVDHTVIAPERVIPAVNAGFGQYVAATCTGCHGPGLAGGPMPGAAPGDPQAANLTPSGNLSGWTKEEFLVTMSTGVTPEGHVLDPAVMPWPIAAEMTPVELEALWVYLQTLEPAPLATR